MIHVVAAVIRHSERKQVFIAKRPSDKHEGGKWEFPGGKVEPDESSKAALCRELQEELAITVIDAQPFIRIRHDYSECSILLDVWEVLHFEGEAQGNEGQIVEWVDTDKLSEYTFPEANRPIVLACLLPSDFSTMTQYNVRYPVQETEYISIQAYYSFAYPAAKALSNDGLIHIAQCAIVEVQPPPLLEKQRAILYNLLAEQQPIDALLYPVIDDNWEAFESVIAGLPVPVYAYKQAPDIPFDNKAITIARQYGAFGIVTQSNSNKLS